jgi:hypothetical protein
MATLIVKENSLKAQQFLEFVRTLSYVNIVEDKNPAVKFKKSVANTLKKSEQGKELIECNNADDMFNKLGI